MRTVNTGLSARVLAICIAASLTQVGCWPTPTKVEREAGTLYVLPLGDSITQGDTKHASYRYPLWRHMVNSGLRFDFVGSTRKHHEGAGPDVDDLSGVEFDRDHEGHWGWRADEVLDKLPGWLEHYPVDLALVHLGTNDVLQGQPLQETLSELQAIVDLLRGRNPTVTILLGQPGQSDWPKAAALPELAEGVATLSNQLDSPSARVISVPLDSVLTTEYTYDGLHPDARGEAAMADMWFSVMEQLPLLTK